MTSGLPEGSLTQDEFARLARSEPRDQVLARLRALTAVDAMLLESHELDRTLALLRGEGDAREQHEQADRLELLADADADADSEGVQQLREFAANLRRVPEYRAEKRAAYEAEQPSEEMSRAMALHGSCYTEEPLPARLARISSAIAEMGDLIKASDAKGDGWGHPIEEYQRGLYRLRQALLATDGPA